MKVNEKTVRKVIKQDLNPELNLLDNVIWSVLESKTNATSHPNNGSLKTTIEEELNHHHHHHIVLAARISLTLFRHSSLSFIALGRSSGQQPVSSHSCWMYVRAGRPAFARPCVGIHKSTSLMSSSLLLQELNKISEKLILKACKLFWRLVDTKIKKWWPYWVNLLFCVYLLSLIFIFQN